MKKIWLAFMVLGLVLAAGCSNVAAPAGPGYVVITMAVNSPMPFHQATFLPTKTPIPSATFTPTLTPTATPLVGCVIKSSIFVRSGPGVNFPAVSGILLGSCVTVLAYSPDHLWAQIADGWVSVQYLNFTHQTMEEELTLAAGATITPTLTLIPTLKK